MEHLQGRYHNGLRSNPHPSQSLHTRANNTVKRVGKRYEAIVFKRMFGERVQRKCYSPMAEQNEKGLALWICQQSCLKLSWEPYYSWPSKGLSANSGRNVLFITHLRDCWAYLVPPFFLTVSLPQVDKMYSIPPLQLFLDPFSSQ